MASLDNKWSKALNGGCTWYEDDSFAEEFTQLEGGDEVAHQFFQGLMDRAEGSGLTEGDYRAPVGLKLRLRRNRPWMAEFFTDSAWVRRDGTYTQYRLYWGEAPADRRSLAACLVGDKPAGPRVERRTWELRQDSQIGTAMD